MVRAWHNSKLSTVKTLVTTMRELTPSSAATAGVCLVKVSLFFFIYFQIFFSYLNNRLYMKAYLVLKSHLGVWSHDMVVRNSIILSYPMSWRKIPSSSFSSVFDSLPSTFTPMLHCINPSCCTKAT